MGIRVPFDNDYDSRWLRVGWKKMKKQRGDAWDRREIMKRRERKEVKGNDERGKRELAKLDNGEGFLEQTPDVSGEWMKRDTYRKAKREQWPRYYFLFAASDQPLTISPVRRCSSTPSFYHSFFLSTLLPFSPFFPFDLSLFLFPSVFLTVFAPFSRVAATPLPFRTRIQDYGLDICQINE